MATDQSFSNFYNKKITATADLKDRFLDYLLNTMREELQLQFRADGAFDDAVVVEPEFSSADNQIDIARSAGFTATDGQGRVIQFDANDPRLQDIAIPPAAAIVFHVGLEQYDVESGVEVNPRTGEVEYSTFKELPGRLGVPDSVTDNLDGTLTIVVESITGADDHTGRTVRVWLKSRVEGGIGPLSSDVGVAFEEVVISQDGGQNVIVTADVFGQSSPSETASDYVVQLVGPTVVRLSDEDLRIADGVFFLAAVTSVAASNPIVTISTADQNVIAFNHSDISEVLRRDGHGDVKIRVTADASDSGEPQIDVIADDNVTSVFSVDEAGNVEAAGDMEVAGSGEFDGSLTCENIAAGPNDVGDADRVRLAVSGINSPNATPPQHQALATVQGNGGLMQWVVNPVGPPGNIFSSYFRDDFNWLIMDSGAPTFWLNETGTGASTCSSGQLHLTTTGVDDEHVDLEGRESVSSSEWYGLTVLIKLRTAATFRFDRVGWQENIDIICWERDTDVSNNWRIKYHDDLNGDDQFLDTGFAPVADVWYYMTFMQLSSVQLVYRIGYTPEWSVIDDTIGVLNLAGGADFNHSGQDKEFHVRLQNRSGASRVTDYKFIEYFTIQQ